MRYHVRRDLENIVEGPSGPYTAAPRMTAGELAEALNKAYDLGFKSGCDACRPAAEKSWAEKCAEVNVEPGSCSRPKAKST